MCPDNFTEVEFLAFLQQLKEKQELSSAETRALPESTYVRRDHEEGISWHFNREKGFSVFKNLAEHSAGPIEAELSPSPKETEVSAGSHAELPEKRDVRMRGSEPAPQRAEQRSGVVLDFVELLLPKRLRDEDLSDAREVIHRLRIAGAPPWTLYLKTLTTGCWCALNAIGYVLSALTGRSSRKS